MSDSPYLYDVTLSDFNARVLDASLEVPVLVDFWASWCAPCRALAPVLAKLADSYQGKIRVAKVNSDEQQALATQYGVRSLPTVKVFRNGAVVDEFVGAQTEAAIRGILGRHVERPSDKLHKAALTALRNGHVDEAQNLLQQVLESDPDNNVARLELAELCMDSGKLQEAGQLLRALPAATQDEQEIKALLARLYFLRIAATAPDQTLLTQRIATDPGDLAARQQLGARLILDDAFAAGMEQFLEIMRRDRRFENDVGRQSLITAFDLLGSNDELANTFRRRMAALLY
jgi:putative thioredoxin